MTDTIGSINNVERFKQRIRAGHVCVGTGISFSDPAISELAGQAGYDFTWIDSEHGPLDLQNVLGHVMAVRGTSTAPFVRVPCNDVNVIKPVVDMAPAAIIVPMVNTAAEAERAVAACRYPPRGMRGFGPRRGMAFGDMTMPQYLELADDQTMVLIQIEHVNGVENLDEILTVPGLDGVCLGPNDLSGSLGKLGQMDDPEVVGAIDTVIDKTKGTDVFLGISTGYDPNTLPVWLKKGIQWINLGVDWNNLFQQSKMVADAFRKTQADITR